MSKYDTVGLFPHNIKTYEKLVEAYKKQNVASIVHSTGTGKSYIVLQLAYDNPDKKFLYISPSNGIIEHIKETIEQNPNLDLERDFKNIEFKTYQGLIRLTEEELQKLNADYLILDEFHHVGAPIWGSSLEKLISYHNNLKILGMSAYPIRNKGTSKERDLIDSDNDELFSGSVVSEYDLCDAMIDGILPKPIYKSAYVHLEKTYDNLASKIKKINPNTSIYSKIESLMNEIKNKIHEAPSMKEVFKDNIRKNGKYIYFCPVMNTTEKVDIQTIIKETKTWIKEMGLTEEDYEIYTSTSTMGTEGYKNRKAFYNDKDLDGNDSSKKLRIMFAINQYNEGTHVPGIDGVIMGRTTSSEVVYFEQLGRALSVRKNIKEEYARLNQKSFEELQKICDEKGINVSKNYDKNKLIELLISPTVIDLSNNIEYIQMLQGKLAEKIEDRGIYSKKNEYSVDSKFDITMENEDLYEILRYIKDCVVMKWEDYYELAKVFYDKYGHLEINFQFKTINGYEYDENGYELGKWLSIQKATYRTGKLSENKLEKLKQIGMKIEDSKNLTWSKAYNLAQEFYNHYGHLFMDKKFRTKNGYDYDKEGYALGDWLYSQKKKYNNDPVGYPIEKINALEDLGINWNTESSYDVTDLQEAPYEEVYNIEDENANYESVYDGILKVNLDRLLKKLSERERFILIHRFGLNNVEPKTYDQIGEIFNLSRNRIRQIEADALRKLKESSKLKDFVQDDRDLYQDKTSSTYEEQKIKQYEKEYGPEYALIYEYIKNCGNISKEKLDRLCYFYIHIRKEDFIKIAEKYRKDYYLTYNEIISKILSKVNECKSLYPNEEYYIEELTGKTR